MPRGDKLLFRDLVNGASQRLRLRPRRREKL